MYRIGICEVKARGVLERGISHYSEKEKLKLEMQVWDTVEELMDDLFAGMELDVLFLGISGENMLQILSGKKIREELGELEMRLIYVAGRECYSREMVQSMPFDILHCGFSAEEAATVIRRAVSSIQKSKKKLEFQFGKTYYSIPYRDVLYMCSDLRRIHVKTTRGNYEFNGLLRDLKKTLPKDFLVIHKSFIVNREHVLYFTYEKVTLSDGTILSISKANRSRAKSMLMSGR